MELWERGRGDSGIKMADSHIGDFLNFSVTVLTHDRQVVRQQGRSFERDSNEWGSAYGGLALLKLNRERAVQLK